MFVDGGAKKTENEQSSENVNEWFSPMRIQSEVVKKQQVKCDWQYGLEIAEIERVWADTEISSSKEVNAKWKDLAHLAAYHLC